VHTRTIARLVPWLQRGSTATKLNGLVQWVRSVERVERYEVQAIAATSRASVRLGLAPLEIARPDQHREAMGTRSLAISSICSNRLSTPAGRDNLAQAELHSGFLRNAVPFVKWWYGERETG
jgi:hypothetical protein